MIATLLRRLLEMLLLLAAQVLVLNHVHFWGFGTPMILVLLLAHMPLGSTRVYTMMWAFVAGLIADIFSNTPGVGSGAMTFVAFLQPSLLKMMVPRDAPEDILPTYKSMGTWTHARYVLLLLLLYDLFYFMLESFSFWHWREVLINLAVSWVSSALICLLLERFRGQEKK